MQLDNIRKSLRNIKECPSNISQDNIRTVFNENFSIIRGVLELLSVSVGSSNEIVNNINILFPENPDERLQYIMKYDNITGKWLVTEFLGTQNKFTGSDAVKVGMKHQHIVNGNITLQDNSQVLVEEGGEVVVLKSRSETIISVSTTKPYVSTANMVYLGIFGSQPSGTINRNGAVLEQGDIVIPDDNITIEGVDFALLKFDIL